MEWTRELADWRSIRVFALAAAVLLTLGVCGMPRAKAAPAAAKPPKTKSAAPAATPAPSPDDDKPGYGPQPPDGKWLKDKDGKQYFLDKIDKDGPFLRLNDHQIRTRWGITVDVAKEDDKFFYYKVYKSLGAFTVTAPPPTQEEIQKLAASYTVNIPEAHRLSFVSFGKGLPTSGQWRNGFDIADMNGDGHPDIVHGPARKSMGSPVIFLGDGKGNWRRWSEAKYPPLPYDYGDAAVADFNGDGKPDIALAMHLRGFVVLLGDGKGNFTNWSKGLDLHVAGTGNDDAGFSSRALVAVDWNHDGRPDILALGEGPRLNLTGGAARPDLKTTAFGTLLYINQGDGTWVRKDQGTSGRENFGDDLTLGDFNGDHRLDFAEGTNTQGRRALVNLAREDGGWNAIEVDQIRPGSYIRSVTAADFNGDGLDDLVVGYLSFEQNTWRSGIDVLYSHPDGTWTRQPLAVEEGRTEVSALAHGDLDGDGKQDLVALTGDGDTWIFYGDGKGGFTRETSSGIPPYPGGCRGYHVRLADLDGDGKDEIVSEFAGENSPMFAPDLCTSGGGMRAWHAVPADSTPARPK
ncbi:MAG TPA: VCBS repeat-containing protein [Thermoanaerobaculia bacterium]|nr:VCBS repeat-containing protein [Thermoanaerobaculia bacterium]